MARRRRRLSDVVRLGVVCTAKRTEGISKTMAALLVAVAAGALTLPAHADVRNQLGKLLAEDGNIGHQFGVSVAISGETAIVGAVFHRANGTASGAAYLFDISDPANPV
ncbi:MAG: FG-GAP repeat protein, partial [Planctomycetes bacterium]|nr:FG-GAP repeat protein [Planctomycetota bacterium]